MFARLAILVAVCMVLVTAIVPTEREMFGSFHGFGKQKMQRYQNRGLDLKQTTSCENVTQSWFQDAVIDNFAPIEQQQRWYNQGQRYWLNKQFWGETLSLLMA
jgi:hypothetical protein